MKKVLKVVGLLLLAIIAFVLIAGLFISRSYHFQKEITTNAPQEKVWGYVSDFKQMDKWSPWKDKDPNIQLSYDGQDGAVGSTYSWVGNKDVGSGSQTLTKSDPPHRIDTHLHFLKPFDAQADAFITLDGENNATKVTWGFDSKYPYPLNGVMKMFMNMDKAMNDEFGSGLNKLKTLAESN
ncbi:MAG: polyketide cyclase [Bacteroidetes bacterium]|nr:MAG: polyketide cyclase [Bacteroidota bacterium]